MKRPKTAKTGETFYRKSSSVLRHEVWLSKKSKVYRSALACCRTLTDGSQFSQTASTLRIHTPLFEL